MISWIYAGHTFAEDVALAGKAGRADTLMRSGQVNTFGVNSTGVTATALVDVQTLPVR